MFNANEMTAYQRVVLERWPSGGASSLISLPDPPGAYILRRFMGALDRAEAVAAGAIPDPVLLALLDKLGSSCETVDDASRIISATADELSQALNDPNASIEARQTSLRLVGPLRTMASRVWDVERHGWRVNPRYVRSDVMSSGTGGQAAL